MLSPSSAPVALETSEAIAVVRLDSTPVALVTSAFIASEAALEAARISASALVCSSTIAVVRLDSTPVALEISSAMSAARPVSAACALVFSVTTEAVRDASAA